MMDILTYFFIEKKAVAVLLCSFVRLCCVIVCSSSLLGKAVLRECAVFWIAYTDNPLYTDSRYNNKIRYNDNLAVTKPSLKREQLVANYERILYLILY